MEYTEKLKRRLEHWMEHNDKHVEEYKKVAEELKNAGYYKAGEYVLKLAEYTDKMNEEIKKALASL